jgi:hypothetical protein
LAKPTSVDQREIVYAFSYAKTLRYWRIRVIFDLWSFSPANLDLVIKIGGIEKRVKLRNGAKHISISCTNTNQLLTCDFICVPWSPEMLLVPGESRNMGFHLKEISAMPN